MNLTVCSLGDYEVLERFHYDALEVWPQILGAVGHRPTGRIPLVKLVELSSRTMTVLDYWPTYPSSRPSFNLDWMVRHAGSVRLMADAVRKRVLLPPEIIPNDVLIGRLLSRQTQPPLGALSDPVPVSV